MAFHKYRLPPKLFVSLIRVNQIRNQNLRKVYFLKLNGLRMVSFIIFKKMRELR